MSDVPETTGEHHKDALLRIVEPDWLRIQNSVAAFAPIAEVMPHMMASQLRCEFLMERAVALLEAIAENTKPARRGRPPKDAD